MSREYRFAEDTKVPVAQTRAEIETILRRHGAEQFVIGWDSATGGVVLGFRIADRQVRMHLSIPPEEGGRSAPDTRRRWRVLYHCLKMQLVAVAENLTTIEEIFHADIVLPSGQTMYEWSREQIRLAYDTGVMPPLLPGIDQAARLLPAAAPQKGNP